MSTPTRWIVDTNVVVAGLLTGDENAPPAIILDRMLEGRLACLVSIELLAEYRTVLLRRAIRQRHGLTETNVDRILEAIALNAVVVDIAERSETAPDPGDNHLWQLLASERAAALITGDRLLKEHAPKERRILTPAEWLDE